VTRNARRPRRPWTLLPLLAALACGSNAPKAGRAAPTRSSSSPKTTGTAPAKPADAATAKETPPMPKPDLAALKSELVERHGEAARPRIERGVDQVAALWRDEDGDLAAFVREQFVADPKQIDATFARLEAVFEQIDGHLHEAAREARRATEVDTGPMLAIDPLLATYDPFAHLSDDLFAGKVAFVALLNFPLTTLAERIEHGPKYSRREWAEARLTARFNRRVPAAVRQELTRATADADLYIAQYNVWMHHLLDEAGNRPFPAGMRLISHWNLRDELKARYADPDGLAKQKMIVKVMERIVAQEIPQAVIDNPRLDWNPFTNAVTVAPAAEVEADAPQRDAEADPAREDDTRYKKLLANFHAARKEDPFSPFAPTAIARSFELGRELPEARVKQLLEQVLTSPLVPRVAAVIEQRLGRELGPQDLWYQGFRANAGVPEAELDRKTRAKYPTPDAFAKDMPRLLKGLQFAPDRATWLAEHIRVDPSRGAGHAMQALRRGDFPRLRTRVGADGMDYKGYNIAVHELGHNVEQVFSLYGVDHTLLAGVPNNAFTEALAFVFQARDLQLLGAAKPDAAAERERVLMDFWQTFEIAGVGLVDVAVWHWLYDHPEATPAQLREATVRIASETWDRYYAPVLGGQGTPLLGIYSHMISYPLYLVDYPMGHLIAFQIEEHMAKTGKLGPEFEKMATQGALLPDVWMTNATGSPIAAEPLLRATEAALAGVEGK
jgi:hypothetical protein